MKRVATLSALFSVIGLTLGGCAPVAIGAYAYNLSGKREARQKFLAEFNENNLEREKAGLQPIPLCTAKQQFDPKWAAEDPICQAAASAG